MKIAIIAPEDTVKTTKLVAEEFDIDIAILEGSMDEGVKLAKKLEQSGYNILIARGPTYDLLLKSNINIPVLPVPVTAIDIFDSINAAHKINEDIPLILTKDMISAVDGFQHIINRKLRIFEVQREVEVEQIIKELAKEGVKIIAGLGILGKYSQVYGIESIVIKSGKESLKSTINEAIRIAFATRKEKEDTKRIKAIIEHSYEGIICIDKKGYITIFNDSITKLLKYQQDDLIGKKIDSIIPELELTENLNNGIKEEGIIKSIKGTKFMISKIPIIVDNEVVNAVAIMRDIDEIQKMEEKIRQDTIVTGHYAKYTFDDVIGSSKITKETIRIGKEYARVDSTIMIEGETGTGKEVFAQSIHNHSNRAKNPFVVVNCAALPQTLLESELFGYASGAFTGADRKGKKGFFELSHTGTIFLDEISEMELLLQGRLLRVLQEKQVMRIGGNKLIPIDARLIVASNKNLYHLVKAGKFREDLYYRLNVLRMQLVPLRNKKDDIADLLNYFLGVYCSKLGKKRKYLSQEALDYLLEYNWPGNARELENFCERLSVMMKKTTISLDDITSQVMNIENDNMILENKSDTSNKSLYNTASEQNLNFDDIEKMRIKKTLISTNGSILKAADELGISRTTLWRKMKKYSIDIK